MVLLQRKLYFLKDLEGANIFQEVGDPTFSIVDVRMLISIETHITCDFPGGWGLVWIPYHPLDPHMISYQYINAPILYEAI